LLFRTSKQSSLRPLRIRHACTLLALSLSLAGCETFSAIPAREPATRNLPPPPTYLQEAKVPPATPGTSPFVVAEQRKQVIEKQNIVIRGAKSAWTKMKATYQKSLVPRKKYLGF
jgi:hypothetical protein